MSASFVQLPSEILIDPNITALDLRIYVICLDFGRKGRGFSQIGHQHLGRLVGKHPKTVAKSIKRLAELGYITVEKIGLNRNDRLRCKKTVKREKSDGTPTIRQGRKSADPPTLVDKSTKKRYKERSAILPANQSKQTPNNPPISTPYQQRSTQTIADILSHQPLTDHLTDQLSQKIRPASFNGYFKNMAVIEADDSSMTISLGQSGFISEWVSEHYSEILNRIADKKVNIVS